MTLFWLPESGETTSQSRDHFANLAIVRQQIIATRMCLTDDSDRSKGVLMSVSAL